MTDLAMTDIERMAREAGMGREGDRWFSDSADPLDAQDVLHAHLERFAALVRADMKERCAKVCDEAEAVWRSTWEAHKDQDSEGRYVAAGILSDEIRALS